MQGEVEIQIETEDKDEQLDRRMDTLVEAFSEEVARVMRRLYDLDRRLGRFERLFEQFFREEATKRLGLGGGLDQAEIGMGIAGQHPVEIAARLGRGANKK